MCKICEKNISNKKNEKLRNYFFKMKEFNKIALGKGLFHSMKGRLCLTKGQLANPEGQVEIKSPSLILLIQIKKKKSKRALFNIASNLWILYLSKPVPDEKRFPIPVCFITSNSDSNQFEFSYLTKLLSTFKVKPSLDVFHSQLSDE